VQVGKFQLLVDLDPKPETSYRSVTMDHDVGWGSVRDPMDKLRAPHTSRLYFKGLLKTKGIEAGKEVGVKRNGR